ncbi:MAG: hypothetical protein ACI841_005153 [Planctomycetota bacterium]|jgi:hypothetical protein
MPHGRPARVYRDTGFSASSLTGRTGSERGTEKSLHVSHALDDGGSSDEIAHAVGLALRDLVDDAAILILHTLLEMDS